MLRSGHREARHRIFGAVEFLNDSDPGDCVCPLEVDQMGGRSDTRRLKQEEGAVSSRPGSVDCAGGQIPRYLLRGDAPVAEVVELVFQALQAPGGLQEVLSKDLLLLSGVCGYSDGVPDLNQNGLMEEEQLSSGSAWSSTRLCTSITTFHHPFQSVC